MSEARAIDGGKDRSTPQVRLPPARVAIPLVGAIAIVARIASGAGTPLWFDETFSAVIATQPTAARMLDWCAHEIGGPVYYIALWLWVQVFGASTIALRALSFAASGAAVALIAWRGHPDRRMRLIWAALLALWLPGLDPATNARCYALAMLATSAQTIALRRLLDAPDRGRALGWTLASTVAILTHSYCVVLAAVGGIVFMAVHRERAIACWPALAPVLLLPAWLWFQLPVLATFTTAGAWYPPFGWLDLVAAPADFFESPAIGAVLLLGIGVSALEGWRSAGAADRATAIVAPIAFALVLALALARPTFVWRYAIPFGPPMLFAVAIWLRGVERRIPFAGAVVIALFAAAALGRTATLLREGRTDYRATMTLEPPSLWLAAAGARHLAFLWDSPTGATSDPARIAEVSGYAFRNESPGARVTVLRAPAGSSPPRVLADALARDVSIDAVIWLADANVPGTLARPDRALFRARGWTCRDFGRAPIRLLGCHR